MKTELIQEGKNAEQRREMEDNYIYEGEALGKVLLFDDVVTTGSSLMGTFWAIKGKTAKIKVLSLAYKSKGLHN